MQNVTNQVGNTATQVQTAVSGTPATTPVQNNGVNIPVTIPPQQPGTQSSGVNIIIYNPSVNPSAGTIANSNNSYNMPVSGTGGVSGATGLNGSGGASSSANVNVANPYPANAYPANYYTQEPNKANSDEVAKSYLANTSIKETVKEKQKKEPEFHKEKIVQLTDDYIKTLENYMNNPNPKVREMAIKEIMERFKEHKSRYTDVALTNLLNKALQDKSKAVRFVALVTLDAEFARGDKLTVDILNKMQSSSAVYGEDALMAADILLKMSRRRVEVTVPGPKPEEKKVK